MEAVRQAWMGTSGWPGGCSARRSRSKDGGLMKIGKDGRGKRPRTSSWGGVPRCGMCDGGMSSGGGADTGCKECLPFMPWAIKIL